MNYFTKYLIIAVLLCHSVFGQDYTAAWYSSDSNHLPQNSVKSIIKDKYGYIWLATENGLVRYDGKKFKVYNSENVKGLKSNRIQFFSGSVENDSIFFLNESKQLYTITNRKIINVNKHIRQPYMSLKEIINSKYIPTPSLSYTDNIYYYDDKEDFLTIQSGEYTYIINNQSISLYDIITNQVYTHKYNYKKKAQFFVLSGNLYQLTDNNSCIKITITPDRLITGKTNFDRKFGKDCTIFTNAIAGQVFAYTNRKLYSLIEENNTFKSQLIFNDSDLPHHNIMAIYYDEKNRILYLGSSNKGLLVIKKQVFKNFHSGLKHSNGTDNVYYGLLPFDNESILATTGEIFPEKSSKKPLKIGSYSDKYMITFDDNGDLWTKNSRNLYRFTKESNFREFDKWSFSNSITALAKGHDGKIWFGTFNNDFKSGGILYFIDPSHKNCKPVRYSRLSFAPSVLNIPNNNTVWGGSWHGLYKINLATKKETKINDFPDCHVRCLYINKSNEIWAGSYGKGLFLYKDGKTTQFPTERNQYLLTTHCIIEGPYGYFWITTNRGLFQVKKQDLYDYAEKKLYNIYYHQYIKEAGFSNNEFNGGCQPCGIILNKSVFLPSMAGIVNFDIDTINPILPKNSLYLDEIVVDNKPCKKTGKLILNRNFGRVSFHISSPYYGNHYNENIEIKLEGPVCQDWTHLDEDIITFSTLLPGKYILEIRKLSGFGSQWIYKSITFEVEPAFWQTSWFLCILSVTGLVIIIFIIRLRIRYIRYKNTLLEKKIILQTGQLQETIAELRKTKEDLSRQISNHKRLIKSITHDIKSPLKFMAITGKFIYNNFENEKESLQENIRAIYTSSFQLYHFVDNFLEYTHETDINKNDSPPYSAFELVEEKIKFFKNIAHSQKTELINNVPENIILTANRHLLAIILHNILDNAIKHTINGTIEVGSLKEENSVSITVTDTGYGMQTDDIMYYNNLFEGKINAKENKKGMGLHMIAELLVILGGRLQIDSEKWQGTKISVRLNNHSR